MIILQWVASGRREMKTALATSALEVLTLHRISLTVQKISRDTLFYPNFCLHFAGLKVSSPTSVMRHHSRDSGASGMAA